MRQRPCPEAHRQLGHQHRGSKHLSSFGRFETLAQNASDSRGNLRRTQPPFACLPLITLDITDSLTPPGISSPRATSTVPVSNPNEKLSHSTAATGRAGSQPLMLKERERRGPRAERSSQNLNLVRHSHERSQMVSLEHLDEILRTDDTEVKSTATHSPEQFA